MEKLVESQEPIGAQSYAPLINVDYIVEGGKTFILTHYNGINVMINCSDGYINVGRLCAEYSAASKSRKNFYGLKRGGRCKRLLSHWKTHNKRTQQKSDYEIKGHLKSQGTYVHPDFINFIALWLDDNYYFTVTTIMNEINRRAHLKGISAEQNFQEVLSHLQSENEEL